MGGAAAALERAGGRAVRPSGVAGRQLWSRAPCVVVLVPPNSGPSADVQISWAGERPMAGVPWLAVGHDAAVVRMCVRGRPGERRGAMRLERGRFRCAFFAEDTLLPNADWSDFLKAIDHDQGSFMRPRSAPRPAVAARPVEALTRTSSTFVWC